MNINFNKYIGKTLELPLIGKSKILGVQARSNGNWACVRCIKSDGERTLINVSFTELETAWGNRKCP